MKTSSTLASRLLPLIVLGSLLGLTGPTYAGEVSPNTCQQALALDDGTPDSGYGFVPSALVGTYVQPFERSQLDGGFLTSVCVCFLKTRGDDEVSFEVVVFAEEDGIPAAQPFAVVPATQNEVPRSVEEAGQFVQVSMPSVPLPTGRVFIGVRWNPSQEDYLFVCNDQSKETRVTPAYFSEDKKPSWTSVFDSKDPIFKPHRALLIRVGTSSSPAQSKPSASAAPLVRD